MGIGKGKDKFSETHWYGQPRAYGIAIAKINSQWSNYQLMYRMLQVHEKSNTVVQ
jgi:hypothetical protein